jgi:formate hydrogenlyase subunit 3/multisubunit Na+/H+ antiporter MnhD subunit
MSHGNTAKAITGLLVLLTLVAVVLLIITYVHPSTFIKVDKTKDATGYATQLKNFKIAFGASSGVLFLFAAIASFVARRKSKGMSTRYPVMPPYATSAEYQYPQTYGYQ